MTSIVHAQDLKGTVTDRSGRPISRARIDVATAAPKSGPNAFCPTCYPDCKKSTQSAEDGSFQISSLAAGLKFSLLITKPGMRIVHTGLLDSAEGPFVVVLEKSPPVDPRLLLKGRVLGPAAEPVPAALVTPVRAYKNGGGASYQVRGIAITVTDENGEFAIGTPEDVNGLVVRVDAMGYCSQHTEILERSNSLNEVHLGKGARVVGRIVSGLLPAIFEPIAIVQVGRGPDQCFVKALSCVTDTAGEYAFENLPTDQKYAIYTPRSVASTGKVISTMLFDAPSEGKSVRLSDIKASPGIKLSGKFVSSSPLPSNAKVALGRGVAWDLIEQPLERDGSFSFVNLPPEVYRINLVTDGFMLDDEKINFHPTSETGIALRLKQDLTDLAIPVRAHRSPERGAGIKVEQKGSPQTQTIAGKVIGRDGRPVEGVEIFFKSIESGSFLGTSVSTDKFGRFESVVRTDLPTTLLAEWSHSATPLAKSLYQATRRTQTNQTNVRLIFDLDLFTPLENARIDSVR